MRRRLSRLIGCWPARRLAVIWMAGAMVIVALAWQFRAAQRRSERRDMERRAAIAAAAADSNFADLVLREQSERVVEAFERTTDRSRAAPLSNTDSVAAAGRHDASLRRQLVLAAVACLLALSIVTALWLAERVSVLA